MVHKTWMVSVELNSVDHDNGISIQTTYAFFQFFKNHEKLQKGSIFWDMYEGEFLFFS